MDAVYAAAVFFESGGRCLESGFYFCFLFLLEKTDGESFRDNDSVFDGNYCFWLERNSVDRIAVIVRRGNEFFLDSANNF